jgi:hypothetical protein
MVILGFITDQCQEKHFMDLMLSGPLPLRLEYLVASIVACTLYNFFINHPFYISCKDYTLCNFVSK